MSSFKKIISFTKTDAFAAAGIYTFTNFFAKGVAFLLLFIYSNPVYITVEENGLLSLLNSSIVFVTPFIYLGILQSTSTDFFKLNKTEFKNFFTSGFVLPIIVSIVSVILFYIFFGVLSHNYNFQKSFIWIIPAIVILLFCNEQYQALLRNNNEAYHYLKLGILRIILEAGVSIGLVVFFAWHWKGRIAGILIGHFVVATLAFFYFKRKGYLFGKVKKKYLKEELVFALPIIVMQVAIFCLTASDKFFLAKYYDNHAVGVYGYACVFASVINIFCSALLQYLMPKIYSYLSTTVINYHGIKKHFIIYTAACFVMLAGIIIVTPFLYKYFIHSAYHPGLRYLFLIATGYFFWGITYFFYSYMLYHKEKKKILLLSFLGICISLLFNWFFIAKYGEYGAALSVCLSYFVFLLVTVLFTFRYIKRIFGSIKQDERINL